MIKRTYYKVHVGSSHQTDEYGREAMLRQALVGWLVGWLFWA